jgi:hypothetical protein
MFFVWLVDCLICFGECITCVALFYYDGRRRVTRAAFVVICLLSLCRAIVVCAAMSSLLVFCFVDCYFFACFRFLCLILALNAPLHICVGLHLLVTCSVLLWRSSCRSCCVYCQCLVSLRRAVAVCAFVSRCSSFALLIVISLLPFAFYA